MVGQSGADAPENALVQTAAKRWPFSPGRRGCRLAPIPPCQRLPEAFILLLGNLPLGKQGIELFG
jgi:hypothetical protein